MQERVDHAHYPDLTLGNASGLGGRPCSARRARIFSKDTKHVQEGPCVYFSSKRSSFFATATFFSVTYTGSPPLYFGGSSPWISGVR